MLGRGIGASVGYFTAGPGGIGTGARWGSAIMSAQYMYEQTTGAAYVRLLQESDLSIEDARKLANSEALAASIIEFGLDYATGGIWKGAGKLSSKATSKIGNKLTQALLKIGVSENGAGIIMNTAKNAGRLVLDASGEGFEEWIQEGMSITADKYARKGKSASPFELFKKSFDLRQYTGDDFKKMNSSFLSGFIIGFGRSGLDGAISYTANKTISGITNAVDATSLGYEVLYQSNGEMLEKAIEQGKKSELKKTVALAEKIEKQIELQNSLSAKDVGTLVKNVMMEIKPTVVETGEVFRDKKYGNILKVAEQTNTQTTVEINTGRKSEKKIYSAPRANILATNNQFEYVGNLEIDDAGASASDTTTTVASATNDVATPMTVIPNGNVNNPPAPISSVATTAVQGTSTITPASQTIDSALIVATDVPAVVSEELREITNADAVIRFASRTASSEIKKLENMLIIEGADDTSRKEIITAALEIESALVGTYNKLRSVYNSVSSMTSNAIAEIKSKVGASSAYWRLFGENIKAISTGNTENIELVAEYATAYSEALKNNNPEKYNLTMVSSDGTDISAQLPQTILKNIIPVKAQNAGEFKLAATHIKNIIDSVNEQIESERAKIYRRKAKTATEPKNITLAQVGDFYEAYGDDAVLLASKLNLQLTSKIINGKEVQMVGFPVNNLERYQTLLGNDYFFNASGTPDVTKVNEQNMHVTDEIAPDSDSLTSTDVDMAENGKIRISEPSDIYNDVFYGTDGSEIILTEDEKSAILKYKSSEAFKLNNKIRSGIELSDEDKHLILNVNLALSKFPIYKGLVYRNIGFDTQEEFEAFLDKYVNNYDTENGITEEAFTSSSKSPTGYEVDRRYKVHFILESITGRDVSNLGIATEAEVLFNLPTTFNITASKIDGNEIYIEGTERAENGRKDNKRIGRRNAAERGASENERGKTRSFMGQQRNEGRDTNDGERIESERLYEKHKTHSESNSIQRGDTDVNEISQQESEYNRRGTGTAVLRDNRGSEGGERFNSSAEGEHIRSGIFDIKANLADTRDERIENGDTVNSEQTKNNVIPQTTSDTPLAGIASQDSEDVKLTDKCELIATKHTKTGDDIWVIYLKNKIPLDDYKVLSGKVKSVGGYYSTFTKTLDGKNVSGFVFKTKPTEKVINTFNDFFDDTKKNVLTYNARTAEVSNNISEKQNESEVVEESKTTPVSAEVKSDNSVSIDGSEQGRMFFGNTGRRDEPINVNMENGVFGKVRQIASKFKSLLPINHSGATECSYVYFGSISDRGKSYSVIRERILLLKHCLQA